MRALLVSSAKDPLAKLLKPSVDEHGPTLEAVQEQLRAAEAALKELALWFAEKPEPPADVFGPLAAFVLDPNPTLTLLLTLTVTLTRSAGRLRARP